ncbi:MAG: Mut7-C RNAse domain-containing protein [Candidatus Omnitrophota bacterium]
MKFIVTSELGRLARWLRLAGHDTLYYTHAVDGTLIVMALRDNRMIITRRKEKIGNCAVQTVVLAATEVRAQLHELALTVTLAPAAGAVCSRCAVCNGELERVAKEPHATALPAYVALHKRLLMRCAACGKIYWHGTHVEKIKEIIDTLQ